MKKIEFVGDWGSGNDELDGTSLRDGEIIIVAWPDGFLEQIAVTVELSQGTVSDHGHEYPTRVQTAYYITKHRGVRVAVPLRGIEAQRVAA